MLLLLAASENCGTDHQLEQGSVRCFDTFGHCVGIFCRSVSAKQVKQSLPK